MTPQAQVPGLVADYFGDSARDEHPVITQAFTPGKGWVRYPIRKRVSVSWLRKLQGESVTAVQIECGGRKADFEIAQVVRHAQRPLFGGRVI